MEWIRIKIDIGYDISEDDQYEFGAEFKSIHGNNQKHPQYSVAINNIKMIPGRCETLGEYLSIPIVISQTSNHSKYIYMFAGNNTNEFILILDNKTQSVNL